MDDNNNKLKGFIAGYIAANEINYKFITGKNPDLEWVQKKGLEALKMFPKWNKTQADAERSS